MQNRKEFNIACLILGMTALLALNLYFKDIQPQDSIDVKNFPRTIEQWSSIDIPLTADEKAILETDNVFIRKYKNPQGKQVYLYVVYSQTNRKVSHPPEICYTGSGVSILENTLDSITINNPKLIIPAHQMLLRAGKASQVTYYWFKVGDVFTASYWKQQLQAAFDSLLGKKTGCALIRVSADVTSSKQEAIQQIKEFVAIITPSLVKNLP